ELFNKFSTVMCPRPLFSSLACFRAHFIEFISMRISPFDSLSERLNTVCRDTPTFDSVCDQLGAPCVSGRQHRDATSHCFTDHKSKSFRQRGEDEEIHIPHKLQQANSRKSSQILYSL